MRMPTSRSLASMRKEGMSVHVVEHFNFFSNKRSDLFGFADVVAIGNGEVRFVQCTTDSHRSDRRKKILSSTLALKSVRSGVVVELRTWGKKGKADSRKLWKEHVERFTEKDFHEFAEQSRVDDGTQGRTVEEQEEAGVVREERRDAVCQGQEARTAEEESG